jgi:hypothetical protein
LRELVSGAPSGASLFATDAKKIGESTATGGAYEIRLFVVTAEALCCACKPSVAAPANKVMAAVMRKAEKNWL